MSLDPTKAADLAIRAIPPAWPLAATVAVNPFLGQVGEDLAAVAARLSRIAGVPVTLPRAWYLTQIDQGHITDADLAEALSRMAALDKPQDLEALKAAAKPHPPEVPALPTVADLAAEVSGIDWPGVIEERFGAWAAGYFDEGQALWAAPRGRGAYLAWKAVATHDLTPEILGLPGFATHVSEAPEHALEVVSRVAERLGLSPEAQETYFHQLLTTLGGWGQAARRLHWQAEMDGGTDETPLDFLAIRLIWEWALAEAYWDQIEAPWRAAAQAHALPLTPTADHVVDAILQAANEIARQRGLAKVLAQPPAAPISGRPALQAAFCIDVRSEVFRRALESVGPDIQTLGFAGFFGLASSHRGFASDVDEHRAPVLLKPSLLTCSGGPEDQAADQSERFAARASRAWGRFKLAAVSSFAFVEATGPLYAAKLLGDALRLHGQGRGPDPIPRFDPALDLEARTSMAGTVLKAMSLTKGFAEVIILAGHGAQVTNNPFASSLHCGACGGYSGEVNARLLASLLNDLEVRNRLVKQGIDIPPDTLFVGALHDTTGDQVTLFDQDLSAPGCRLDRARTALAAAGALARAERALRLPGGQGAGDVARRCRDWAEVRPEWGLAGCQAFIAAPRSRTQGKSLQGRAFLHDYDWRADKGFGVLELILTAPVVVASWISLQYYGSTVAPALFGAGDKLLHNVVGGMGVVEGNGGTLRTGLPWQSVHDGETYVHEPLRLSVLIEAPTAEISDVLSRHPDVRALFDNGWLHLFGLDDRGHMAWRYCGDLQWQAHAPSPAGGQS